VTREQLLEKLAKDPRFQLVQEPGTGFIIPGVSPVTDAESVKHDGCRK
jgi:hypothetical protein